MNRLSSHPNLIVVIPHQDDEVMVAAEITARREAGHMVAVATATDGGASTEYHLPGPPPYDPQTHPEAYREHLTAIREEEHARSLALMSIDRQHQHAFGLPDGQLREPRHLSHLQQGLTTVALNFLQNYGDSTFLTLGPEGFDSHEDHIASHEAACLAAQALGNLGIYTPVLSLNATGEGSYTLPIDYSMKQHKMDILRCHPSQMKFHPDGSPSTEFFDRFMTDYGYGRIFEQETYDWIY